MSRPPAGSVYVFGSGDCGQLGLGDEVPQRKRPTLLPYFGDKAIVSIAAGGLHTLALSAEGSVYSWGCNDEKALGHAAPEYTIGRVGGALAAQRVVSIACGDSISAALTDQGRVYTWGTFRDSKGVIGFSEASLVQDRPTLLSSLSSHKITQISAGANHLVALTAEQQLFSWGCGEQGQLGRRVLERHKVKGLAPTSITPRRVKFGALACGSYHTLGLTAATGEVYAWGLNNYGQLGLGDKDERVLPEPVAFAGAFVQLAAGEHHSVGLTAAGQAWGWGRTDSGQLCTVAQEYLLHPAPLQTGSLRFSQIASGGNHCLAIDASLKHVYAWGFGGMGQLGNGRDDVDENPTPVKAELGAAAQGGRVLQVQGGGQHSVVLVETPQPA